MLTHLMLPNFIRLSARNLLRPIVSLSLMLLGLPSSPLQAAGIAAELPAVRDTVLIPQAALDQYLQKQLHDLKQQGYWDASFRVDRQGQDTTLLEVIRQRGERPTIWQVEFPGLDDRIAQYLQREYFLGRAGITSSDLNRAEHRLVALGYILKGRRQVTRDRSGEYHVSYGQINSPEISLDALAAFSQAPDADTLAWFGHLNVFIPNLDGRGKSLRFNWQRLKSSSEQFQITYQQPWLFGQPLQGSINYGREVVDGNYQIIQSRIGLDWSIDWDRSLIFDAEQKQSLITYDGQFLNPEWRAVKRQMLGLGYVQTRLQHGEHQGLDLSTALYQEVNLQPNSINRFSLRSELEWPLFAGLYFAQRSSILLQNRVQALTDPSLLEPLGGVNSVRGYAENRFRSPSVASLQHELQVPFGRGSGIFAIFDLGAYTDDRGALTVITGYGAGLQLRSGRGPLRLVIATHPGLALGSSFLHIEYNGGLSWIKR